MALSEVREQGIPAGAGEASAIEPLTRADIEAGLALSDAAGWNQTADDWGLFIGRGRAIGCRDRAGRLVATAAALPYGRRAGWISMVLVAPEWRHRGLASALLHECVAHLQAAGALPLLDATPVGAAVYRRLGFSAGFGFERWQSSGGPSPAAAAAEVRRADAADIDRIAALDRSASGLDRRFLLEAFVARPQTQAWLGADGRGFAIARAGRRATQIGPIVASGTEPAIALLASAAAASPQPLFVDVPVERREIGAWLEAQGWRRQRPFVRMSLAAPAAPVVDERCVALAGPEFG